MAARGKLRAPNRCAKYLVPTLCGGGGETLCRAPCATMQPDNFCEMHKHGFYEGGVNKPGQINKNSTHEDQTPFTNTDST